ncbi:MAG: Gfo/Idh/MocA family oxidoreductase [Kiritimatiellae bacterium]|nr:Gfo/Idh/MocA family oxidoreductase [Kiritimatiellia bacterium]
MIHTTRPPVKIGIAGLGRAGLEMHCEELAKFPELFKIVAVCDPMKERRDIVRETYPECRSYRRYADLIDDPDVEMVDIATRSDDHAAHAIQALKSNKWVHLERPICSDHDEAMVLRAAAMKAGNRLLVRQNYRYEPAFIKVKEIIESGVLGNIYNIVMRRGTYNRRDDWQAVKRCSGGATLSQGSAFLDQALILLKMPPVKVWADLKRVASVGDAEDYMHVLLRNQAGLTVDIKYSGGRISNDPLFRVCGKKGEFTLYENETEGLLKYINPKQELRRRRASVRTPTLGSFGRPEQIDWREKKVSLKTDGESGMDLIWVHVFNAIRENINYPITLDSAIEVIRILSIIKKDSSFA